MPDPRKAIGEQFRAPHRFSNFGPCLNRIKISGFRGVDIDLSFNYPITALTGFNGAGKSTVGQLVLCGYKKLSSVTLNKRFYVKDFFPVSVADPKPFREDASITYYYQTDRLDVPQELTVSRAQTEWSGYKRQPERNAEYVGFTVYIPKVERRDLSIYNASTLTLTDRREIERAAEYVSRILGSPYEEIYFQGVAVQNRSSELGVAKRFGAQYSENNMGFGEGRLVHTVRLLENCPEQSLIVLEEPETSLHEYAQYEFVKYLIDVVERRHHQIIMSSHSGIMMDALPPEARKLLSRTEDGVRVFDNVSSTRIRTALSAGESGHFIICVEDVFAQSFLREVLRRYDLDILSCVEIIPFGDVRAVKSAKAVIENSGKNAIAVLDADQNPSPSDGILTLPGSKPPEREVFDSIAARNKLKTEYDFDFAAFEAAHPAFDHHKIAEHIAGKKSCAREVLEADCIRAFLDERGAEWCLSLCEQIKRAVR